MRRSLAFCLLVSFAAASTFGATCLRTCSEGHRPLAPSGSCHFLPAPEHRVAGTHDCTSHLTPLAATAKRIEPVIQLSMPAADDGPVVIAVRRRPLGPASDNLGLIPPLIRRLTPLRI
ncbi:MAG: hypothetical protein ACM4AI_07325 [Acidobacteriota bacterium]